MAEDRKPKPTDDTELGGAKPNASDAEATNDPKDGKPSKGAPYDKKEEPAEQPS